MIFEDLKFPNRYKAFRKALGSWLTLFSWQVFVTLTFAYRVSEGQADREFRTLIDRLERYHRAPIGWIRGDEYRWSGCGMPAIARHYHALLCSDVRLNPLKVGSEWRDLGHFGRNVDVRKYDPGRWATEYCVKFVGEPGGDWKLSNNLGLFAPTANGEGNHRMRRRWLRHQQRVARAE
jgi:hypothetical protein